MELLLNFAWMTLAALMCLLWVCCAPGQDTGRRTQFVALALVILILFPVISATDDLLFPQSPAETSGSQRKNHIRADAHTAPPSLAEAFPASFAVPASGLHFTGVPGTALAAMTQVPTLEAIQSRPPPAA